jgi:hypothetical protein
MAVEWSYDRYENVFLARHPQPIHLSTSDAILAYFDDGIAYWRRNSGGRRAYILVDYENLTTEPDVLDFYAQQVKRVLEECAITVIRFGGSFGQRTAGRMMAIKLHTPSNTYANLTEALQVVKGLKSGAIKLRKVG